MAAQKPPAFQFYPKDFVIGTATFSLQEVGFYMRLLCYAWDVGSVPNDPRERSRIAACSRKQESLLWSKVGKKFALDNGVFVNERMETERQKQAEYRRRQSDNGKASAASRGNGGSTKPPTVVQPSLNEATNQNSTLQSSFASAVRTPPKSPADAGDLRVLERHRRQAKKVLDAHLGYCQHTHPCADRATCVNQIAAEIARAS